MQHRVPSVPQFQEHSCSAPRTALARALVERARTTTEGFCKLTWMRCRSPARCLCTYRLCPHRYPVAADRRTVSALTGHAAKLTATSIRSTIFLQCCVFGLRFAVSAVSPRAEPRAWQLHSNFQTSVRQAGLLSKPASPRTSELIQFMCIFIGSWSLELSRAQNCSWQVSVFVCSHAAGLVLPKAMDLWP